MRETVINGFHDYLACEAMQDSIEDELPAQGKRSFAVGSKEVVQN
jgi:hypothetical protein